MIQARPFWFGPGRLETPLFAEFAAIDMVLQNGFVTLAI